MSSPDELRRIREMRNAVPGLRITHYRDMVQRGMTIEDARATVQQAEAHGVDLNELRAENDRLREVLRELVELKGVKDHGLTNLSTNAEADYRARKVIAWHVARAALGGGDD